MVFYSPLTSRCSFPPTAYSLLRAVNCRGSPHSMKVYLPLKTMLSLSRTFKQNWETMNNSNTVTSLRSTLIGAVHPVSFRSCSPGRMQPPGSLGQGCKLTTQPGGNSVRQWYGLVLFDYQATNRTLCHLFSSAKSNLLRTRGEFKQKNFSPSFMLIFSYTFRANKLQLIQCLQFYSSLDQLNLDGPV